MFFGKRDGIIRAGVSAIICIIISIAFTVVVYLMNKTAVLEKAERNAEVICLDPGHPTEFNSGMHHVRGLREVDINWEVALKLRNELESRGFRVVMTKNRVDELVSNPRRSIIANDAGSRLMIRLHCDAGPSHGYTIYYPNRMGYDGKHYGPVKTVRAASKVVAYRLRSGMRKYLSGFLRDRGVRGESTTRVGEWKGSLRGSVYISVPVVTVEMVFLTNYHDAEFIRNEAGKNLMAKALASGISLALADPGSRIEKKISVPIVYKKLKGLK